MNKEWVQVVVLSGRSLVSLSMKMQKGHPTQDSTPNGNISYLNFIIILVIPIRFQNIDFFHCTAHC